EGYCTLWGVLPVDAADAVRDMALVRGGGARGRVVDERGAGVGSVFVGAGVSFEISIGEATDWRRAVVAADGRFAGAGLDPSNQYMLCLRAPGLGTRALALPRPVQSGEMLDLGDVVLRPAGGIEGRAVDAAGAALAGARVFLQGLDAQAWQLLGHRAE